MQERSDKTLKRSDITPAGQPPSWIPTPLRTSWDDLLENVDCPNAWEKKRLSIETRFLSLIRNEAAPETPADLQVEVEREWDGGEFRILYVSYQVEADERAHAYVAVPNGPVPEDGFPGVVCLHGTTNWGARRTLGLPPEPDDPQAHKGGIDGMDYARQLVRRGYVTISPEHFCSAARVPAEGPYDTAAFYRKHPDWSAVGKYIHDSRIACSVLAARPKVNAARLGVTGHSLGGHGSIWLAACDDRIRCAAPSCSGLTFRENPEPLHWSRDHWYVYFPQLRTEFLSGRKVQCDFHEMMALIAPRPLLERFALNDGDPTCQSHRVMLHLKLREIYRLLGREQAHAFLVFGDGHSIPDLSRECMLSWMDRWLKHEGDPLGAWDARLTRTA
ncbi:MAG: dienelactone hydrolase family protein [Planctomycetes bacterium]|nr:dienelactone hydrolase family protein [Planctomycetota bacterium]